MKADRRAAVPPVIAAVSNGAQLVIWETLSRYVPPQYFLPALLLLTAEFLLLAVLMSPDRRWLRRVRLEAHIIPLVLVGLLGGSLNLMAALGVRESSATTAAIVLRNDLLFSAILGWIVLRERVELPRVGGAALMLTGSALALELGGGSLRVGSGVVWLLASAMVVAVNALIIKVRLTGVPDAVVALFNATFASLSLASGTWLLMPVPAAPIRFPVALVVQLGLLASILSATEFLGYYRGLRWLPIWVVRTLYMLSPVTAALLRYAIVGEWPSPLLWGSVGLVGAGTLVMTRSTSRGDGVGGSGRESREGRTACGGCHARE